MQQRRENIGARGEVRTLTSVGHWFLRPACMPKFQHTRRKTKKSGTRGGTRTRRTLVLSQVRLPITSLAQKHGLERWFRFTDALCATTALPADLSQEETWCPEQELNLHKLFVRASASCKRRRLTGLLHRREPGSRWRFTDSLSGAKFGGCVGNRTPTVPASVGSFALMLLRLLTVHARSS